MFLYRIVLVNLETDITEEVFAVGADPVVVLEKAKAYDANAVVANLALVAATEGNDFARLLDTEVKPTPEVTAVEAQ